MIDVVDREPLAHLCCRCIFPKGYSSVFFPCTLFLYPTWIWEYKPSLIGNWRSNVSGSDILCGKTPHGHLRRHYGSSWRHGYHPLHFTFLYPSMTVGSTTIYITIGIGKDRQGSAGIRAGHLHSPCCNCDSERTWVSSNVALRTPYNGPLHSPHVFISPSPYPYLYDVP